MDIHVGNDQPLFSFRIGQNNGITAVCHFLKETLPAMNLRYFIFRNGGGKKRISVGIVEGIYTVFFSDAGV